MIETLLIGQASVSNNQELGKCKVMYQLLRTQTYLYTLKGTRPGTVQVIYR